jgi:hypothetical protein
VQDICAGHGQLTTTLSPAFLNAQVPSLQTAINNLLDTEHGKGMRGLVRVVTELLAAEKITLEDGSEVHAATQGAQCARVGHGVGLFLHWRFWKWHWMGLAPCRCQRHAALQDGIHLASS